MAVGDGQDPNRLFPDDVCHVIREHLEIDTSVSARTQSRKLCIIGNPVDVAINFIPKPLPKA